MNSTAQATHREALFTPKGDTRKEPGGTRTMLLYIIHRALKFEQAPPSIEAK